MRIASVQLEIKARPKDATLSHVLNLLDQTRGCDLVLLPELWPCGFFAFDNYERDSESIEGPTVQALQAKARELKVHLVMGSFVERDGGKLFNSTLLLGSDGKVMARYRKIHLFGFQSEEKRLLCRGDEVTVVPTPWGRAGMATCYDLRFPEMFRRMTERGAEFFLVVSAWPQPRLESWILFNRARGHENLAYLFSCNCAGTQGNHRYAGHSMFVDPRGKVIAEGPDGEGIVRAEVDIGQVAQVRREFPALEDRVFI
jgi:predicted amidohydrolase